jgi:glucose-1-phosphate cytidylyltransferase
MNKRTASVPAGMKTVILAGGFGTRLSEETGLKPKPLIEIGGKPILWHIMKIYSAHGLNDFVICLGFKGYAIKEFFANYFLHMSDVTIDLARNKVEVHHSHAEPWRVTLVDTGENTMTGGRIKRIQSYIDGKEFCLTYGDGVGDVDITRLIQFHRKQGGLATLTATQPPGRFGALRISRNRVKTFKEKPDGDGAWVNSGFFVCSPRIFSYIKGDDTVWEREPLERLARGRQLATYLHRGFWQPVDTLRDKTSLQSLWEGGAAPWKVWKD